jgi:hypothetical protein
MAASNKMSRNVASNIQEFWIKYFGQAIALTGMLTGFAVPAFAASHGMDATMMTCADFSAMDADGQMKAMDAMSMASEGMTSDQMASDDAMASDDEASDAMASDEGASEAMASDDEASSDMASDAMASDDMASDTMMATATTCADNLDMMAMDAMMAHKG